MAESTSNGPPPSGGEHQESDPKHARNVITNGIENQNTKIKSRTGYENLADYLTDIAPYYMGRNMPT